ncbi:MAG: hypothetical protein FJ309_00910 [Planctomycetes bacterium]|nr:hypothetical protein [Planctomycetota bacterium]MBM4012810.1 hypothetical protein [Planctomycetota bacterium]
MRDAAPRQQSPRIERDRRGNRVLDINPTPAIDRARQPKTPVSEDSRLLDDPAAAIDDAVRHAARFGLETKDSRRICDEVRQAVSRWRSIGKRLGIPASTLSAYADAFHVV